MPWLLDAELAAAEVRRNAARGFKAVTFPELPERLGLPSLHTGWWDPFMAACEETGTVICLHVGSSSTAPTTSSDAPADTIGVLFFGWAMFAAVDWLYSKIPVRYPDICRSACPKAGSAGSPACSTGSTTWPATRRSTARGRASTSRRARSCSATSGSARSTIRPASSSATSSASTTCCSRPTTRTRTAPGPTPTSCSHRQIGHFPADDIRKLTWENASKLFDHPVPDAAQTDPDPY